MRLRRLVNKLLMKEEEQSKRKKVKLVVSPQEEIKLVKEVKVMK